MTDDRSSAVVREFSRAFRPYANARRKELGLAEPGEWQSALSEGETWLRDELRSLLDRPYREQRRGPLEVFQEALRFPTAALRDAGIPPPDRDPVQVSALPGDLYDLAPASSAALGEEAWTAHLAWGAAKAAAVAHLVRPRVGILTRNLLDRSRLEEAVKEAGAEPVVLSGDRDDLAGAVVDLEHPVAFDSIKQVADLPVIAYGPHVDRERLEAAEQRGAIALPRSQLFSDPAARLRSLLEAG